MGRAVMGPFFDHGAIGQVAIADLPVRFAADFQLSTLFSAIDGSWIGQADARRGGVSLGAGGERRKGEQAKYGQQGFGHGMAFVCR